MMGWLNYVAILEAKLPTCNNWFSSFGF